MIDQMRTTKNSSFPHRVRRRLRRQESGFALIAVLAAMTITLVIMAAALPSLKHQMQREREEEMFYRAEQIANAIERYRAEHGGGQFPTSLDQLTELNAVGKSKRFLRASAKIDPMTSKGEWRLVHPGDPVLRDLATAYVNTMKQPPQGLLAQLSALTPGSVSLGANNTDQGQSSKSDDLKLADTGPVVGVVSKSKGTPIRNYYGLETYDKSVVIAGTPTPGQLIIPGLVLTGLNTGGGKPTPNDPRCPNGGFPFEIEGRIVCTGKLFDGQCPPGPKGDDCRKGQTGGGNK